MSFGCPTCGSNRTDAYAPGVATYNAQGDLVDWDEDSTGEWHDDERCTHCLTPLGPEWREGVDDERHGPPGVPEDCDGGGWPAGPEHSCRAYRPTPVE